MDEQTKNKVTMYGAPWCGYCNQLMRVLHDNKVDFVHKNVDNKEHEAEMLEQTDGRYLIPTLVIGDKVMQNPTWVMVKEAING